ncbi:putative bifunctional diguanylate cyclase/phosphodiesterase [Kineococcus rubinsiae]|uniref:putative bifunctional diguanylate cyclase/phosphodiesterase n=1 Tax=Kineococcus rubinsiae TaxID=2609562 RepID=UPI00142FFE42|nr:EAL domain-containing protein [Kineococcus rubinsiae]NIZ92986.1 EAL domain-containing protein [Kineococcus rubinsiae]
MELEAWRGRGDDLHPGVSAALLHLVGAGDQPVVVVSRPADGLPVEVPRIRWANAAAADLLGVAADHLVDLAVSRVLRGAGAASVLLHERSTRFAVQALTSAGSARSTEVVAWPVPLGTALSRPTHLRSAGAAPLGERPGSERTALEGEDYWVLQIALPSDERTSATLRAAEERFATLAQSSPVPTIVSDVGARLSHVNDAFAELLGVPADTLHGTGWLAHVPEEERAAVVQAVADVLDGHRTALDTRLCRADGQLRWVQLRLAPSRTPGYGAGFIATVEDVTERLARESRLAYQAQHDLLTGLPNRLALLEHLSALSAQQERPTRAGHGSGPGIGVLVVDLDDFKTVNDGLGPEAGDEVLVEVARRLSRTVRGADLVARPGGDEFVLVCHDLVDADAVAATARRVLDAVLAPVDVNGLRLRLGASVGVVLLPEPPGPPEELLRDAAIAVAEAKAAGGGRWQVLDDAVRRTARRTLRLIADLREAVARGALDVAYQPVVQPGRPAEVVGVEALVRWRHPEFGPVDPQTFVGLAERSNLVAALDAHVLTVALRDLARWRAGVAAGDLPHAPRWVAVNVSATTLSAPGFAEGVRRRVADAGLQLADVCLEVTETALATDLLACRTVLEGLRADGITVAVDDFGTGFSSLAYLKDLPVDHLKVDRSFVRDLHSSGDGPRGGPARAVAAAVVSLARTLGLGVVAEGVETLEQDAVLVELGCDYLQGYLYSRPVPADALVEVLRAGGTLQPQPAAPAPVSPVGSASVGPAPVSSAPRPATVPAPRQVPA